MGSALNNIASSAGSLQNIIGLIVVLIVLLQILKPGGIKRFFLGRDGDKKYDEWQESRKRINQSRAEIDALILKNHIDSETNANHKKR